MVFNSIINILKALGPRNISVLKVRNIMVYWFALLYASDIEREVRHGGTRCSDRGRERHHSHLLRGGRNGGSGFLLFKL